MVWVAGDSEWESPVWSGLEVEKVTDPHGPLGGILADASGVIGLARIPAESYEVAKLLKSGSAGDIVVVAPVAHTPHDVRVILALAVELGAKSIFFERHGASPFSREVMKHEAAFVCKQNVRHADGGEIFRGLKASGYEIIGFQSDLRNGRLPLLEGRCALVLNPTGQDIGGFWKHGCDRFISA